MTNRFYPAFIVMNPLGLIINSRLISFTTSPVNHSLATFMDCKTFFYVPDRIIVL